MTVSDTSPDLRARTQTREGVKIPDVARPEDSALVFLGGRAQPMDPAAQLPDGHEEDHAAWLETRQDTVSNVDGSLYPEVDETHMAQLVAQLREDELVSGLPPTFLQAVSDIWPADGGVINHLAWLPARIIRALALGLIWAIAILGFKDDKRTVASIIVLGLVLGGFYLAGIEIQ